MPIAVAASAMLLAACDACARTDSAGAQPGASAPRSDPESAPDGSVAVQQSTLGDAMVTESLGARGSSSVGESAARDTAPAGSVASAPRRSALSAEEHIEPSCASPATVDQQRCLSASVASSDLLVARYFQALILRLESEAGVTSGTEPAAVQRLRATQAAWVAYRDEECRRRQRGREGPLWAPTRARCIIDYSTQRADELAGVLAERRALVPLAHPAPSAQPTPPKHRKPTPSKRSRAHKPSRQTRTHRR